ncbi:MAG: hypothetical protein JWO84_271 [Parcubacteria group bacterium]|nr:hypothetical protein [Parcubacteria group bacterium]
MVPVNYLAVLVAAIAAFVLGALWYGPFFGRAWMNTLGMNMDEMKAKAKNDPSMQGKMMKGYAITALGSLLMAFVLAHALVFAGTYQHLTGVMAGLEAGIWNWLGFVAPVSITGVLWESKSWKWWFITAGYYLVALALMGVILSLWQ